ncbi:MAG: hypothetical protein P8J32_04680 [bacterium]|nr:hypothetical protein [bacterium]
MKKLNALYAFMQANGKNLSYNDDLQKEFEKISKSALREIAKQLPLVESKVYFNKGGIAVSGDAHLMGMFANGIGIYISVNEPLFGSRTMNFLFRTITHMKDYTGGTNNYMTDFNFEDETVVARIKNLCGL